MLPYTNKKKKKKKRKIMVMLVLYKKCVQVFNPSFYFIFFSIHIQKL